MRSFYMAAFVLMTASTAAAQEAAVTQSPAPAEVAEPAAPSTAAEVRIPERAALQAPRLQSEQREQAAPEAATRWRLFHNPFYLWLAALVVVAGVILIITL